MEADMAVILSHPNAREVELRQRAREEGGRIVDEVFANYAEGNARDDALIELACLTLGAVAMDYPFAPERAEGVERRLAEVAAPIPERSRDARLDRLDQLQRYALTGDNGDAKWIRACIGAYLAARGSLSMEAAFSLKRTRGGLTAFHAAAIEQRDAALIKMATQLFPDFPPCTAAREIYVLLGRYAAVSWSSDKRKTAVPPDYIGSPKEHCFAVLIARGRVPSLRAIRRVLAMKGHPMAV